MFLGVSADSLKSGGGGRGERIASPAFRLSFFYRTFHVDNSCVQATNTRLTKKTFILFYISRGEISPRTNSAALKKVQYATSFLYHPVVVTFPTRATS